MTLQELRIEMARCQSLAECDDFLLANLHEIRPIFYGFTRRQLQEGRRYLDYENAFLEFTSSAAGRAIWAGNEPPATVVALLIFFLSLFERAQLYTAVLEVAKLLPAGPLRQQGEAIFEYKNIQNTATDYLDRFDRILTLLQEAWNSSAEIGRGLCEDLLSEYAIDALTANIDISRGITSCFSNPSAQQRYPILSNIQTLLNADLDGFPLILRTIRSQIIEAHHAQACALVPDCLITRQSEELTGEALQPFQAILQLPDFLLDKLDQMGAEYNQQRQNARFNFDADSSQNRIYLGTYFPRTVIESWNIFTELFSVPIIQSALRQKDVIRLLDIGSGTGAAVVGILLALRDWGECEAVVKITSLDTNQDALAKQIEILASLREQLPFEIAYEMRTVQFPFDIEGYVPVLASIADSENYEYDLITCWKFLCEFYNSNFASAQGLIRNTLNIASRMLSPYGLYVVADVTANNNLFEYFTFTLNREANEHDAAPNTETRTILPLPCGRRSGTCYGNCYTQRHFQVRHRLTSNDLTKIAYRVLAPDAFAHSITATFTDLRAYRINAARQNEACFNGRRGEESGTLPCGYTGFFTGEN